MDPRSITVLGLAVALSLAGCASDGDTAPAASASASGSWAPTSASPTPTRAAPTPTPTLSPTASPSKPTPPPTRSTATARPAPSTQPATGTPSPSAAGFPTSGDALAAYLATKDRVYVGPCENADLSQDLGKTCSRVVEDRGGEIVLLVGETFSEFDSYVLVRRGGSGWLVVKTAAVPYPDDDGTLPF